MALVPAAASAATLERGPYVQRVGATEATIAWRTDEVSSGAVRYGAAPDALDKVVSADALGAAMEVRLTGLAPGTRYFYEVRASGTALAGGDLDHSFTTAPAVGERRKLRAWIVGDSGVAGAAPKAVLSAMLAHVGADRPALVLHAGDLAYDAGTDDELTSRFFAPYAELLRSAPVWPALGNHDGASVDVASQSGPYFDAFALPRAGEAGGLPSGTEAYYSFDRGNVHFVVLDSYGSPRGAGEAMLTWLAADLAATSQEWIVASWHHPPYTKGTHDSDLEAPSVEMRTNALPILEAGGVDLVISGHSHGYERSFLVDGGYETPTTAQAIVDGGDGRPQGDGPYVKPAGRVANRGAIYVVAGHGGAPLGGAGGHPLIAAREASHGSLILDVHENRLTLINVREDGVVSDHVALIKGEGIEIARPNGGESIVGGSTTEIQWATVGAIEAVRIDYSLDGGASWSPVIGSTPNVGAFSWATPRVVSQRALVRVRDVSDPARGDESNASFALVDALESTVIPFGAVWRYFDQGIALGVGWRSLGYDDSGWASGPAQLGFGEGDEATLLDDTTPRRPSVYLRRRFELDAEVSAAGLRLLYDDGAAVWINGAQVAAVNVDGLAYGDWAASASADNARIEVPIALDPSPFVVGENVIAVMLKQAGPDSTDLSFDLELAVTTRVPPPATSEGDAEGESGGGADDDGGCACAATGGRGGLWAGILVVLGWRRRRR